MSQALAESPIFTEDDYYNLPENIRAELIDGQFYNMSAPSRIHQEILMELSGTIRDYIRTKKGPCKIYPAPFAVKLFDRDTTIVEPDITVVCDQNKLTDRGCSGAPDWVIEIISPSTASHDYIRKLKLYSDAGVREYWIVNPLTQTVLVYFFEFNDLKVQPYTFQESIKPNIFDDLWIDFKEF
ncbi:MAG: Uma2 family endonuclease [Lachnospiraceae bacterium]|nr:Uma2 family endonuclease [Lachnospiraceae bacterium]MCI9358256.1 Uma2 family endonuclease [Lachnospiraceae bacterium]